MWVNQNIRNRTGANLLFLLVAGFCFISFNLAGGAQPHSETWVFPTVSPADHFSEKENRQFETQWKNFGSGKIQKARKGWNSILKKHPASPRALTALSFIDLSSGTTESGIIKLEAALKSDPRYLPALQTLAHYFNGIKDYERAYDYTAQWSKANPSDPRTRVELESLRLLLTDQYVKEAQAARANGKWAAAEEAYLQAISKAPELSLLSRELGDILVYEGKVQQAEDSYTRAIRQDPSDIETKKKLADLFLKTKQEDKAAALLKEISATQEPDAETRAMLNRVLAHSDPIEVALSELRRRPQINRGDLGGLLAVRFPFLKEFQSGPPVILSDLKNHWAGKYLPLIANLNLIPAFPNHQFKPFVTVRRYEVAVAANHLLTLLNRQPPSTSSTVRILDVPKTNVHYNAISQVVSLDLMKLDNNNRFRPNESISGEEALQLVNQIEKIIR
ncbi:MAG: tetratricopeptide repeat protein [Acidobacteriia bacterium]|nr:tetratricopeptide repeat protein [Terriglobia bacterium]